MLCNVVKTLLHEPIDDAFGALGESFQVVQLDPDFSGADLTKSLYQLADRGTEAELIQDGRTEGTDEATGFDDRTFNGGAGLAKDVPFGGQ